jgi:hypothetical protein
LIKFGTLQRSAVPPEGRCRYTSCTCGRVALSIRFTNNVNNGIAVISQILYTPSVSKYLSSLTFFYNFDHSFYSKKCMQVSCILYATCFIIVSILSLTHHFTYLQYFLNKTNSQSCKKNQRRQIFRYGGNY